MRPYEKPTMCKVNIASSQAVAAVCWGHASSGKPMYFDVSGPGYATVYIASGSNGCSEGIIVRAEFSEPNLSDATKQKYMDEIYAAIARAEAESGGKMPPFKNNDYFYAGPDSSWS